MKSSRSLFILLLMLVGLFFTGCSQFKERAVNYNIDDLIEKIDVLTEKAEEIGFNKNIITALYSELKKNPTNQEIISLLKFHAKALTQKKSVNGVHKGIANSLAQEVKAIGPINDTFFEDYSTFNRQTYRINHIAKILNQKFGIHASEINTSMDTFLKMQKVRKVLGYSALIDSYNKLYESAEKLPSNRDEDYWKFYKNLFLFMADFYFLEEKIAYKTAYTSTGKIAAKLGLAKTQTVLGPMGYGLLLSEIHWMLRGEINESWSDLLEVLRNNSLI